MFDNKTDLERKIIQLYDRNPDMGATQIASRAGCSASYARKTIKKYRGGGLLGL